MAKPHRLVKKANHGSRPANSKARRLKRAKVPYVIRAGCPRVFL